MPQTTDSIWGGAAAVGISTDGSSWTAIESHAMKVTPEGGDRRVGEAYVFDDENPIVKVGKLNSRDTRVDLVYTEQAADAFEVVRAQFEAAGGGTMYVPNRAVFCCSSCRIDPICIGYRLVVLSQKKFWEKGN
jgi:hypothetical protein